MRAEIERRTLKIRVLFKTKSAAIPVAMEDTWGVFASKACAHFLSGASDAELADVHVFLAHNGSILHNEWLVLDRRLPRDAHVTLEAISEHDWPSLPTRSVVGHLQLLRDAAAVSPSLAPASVRHIVAVDNCVGCGR